MVRLDPFYGPSSPVRFVAMYGKLRFISEHRSQKAAIKACEKDAREEKRAELKTLF